MDFHHALLLLSTRFLFLQGLPEFSSGLLPPQDTSLRFPFGIQGLGSFFSPVHYQGPQPWRVSYYTLFLQTEAACKRLQSFKGWLLLSLPSRCLGLKTPFLT